MVTNKGKRYKNSIWWDKYRQEVAHKFFISEATVDKRIKRRDPEILNYLISEGKKRKIFSEAILKKFEIIEIDFEEKLKLLEKHK